MWKTRKKLTTIGLLAITVFISMVMAHSTSATFHLPPCSEPPDQADVTIYLNETVPDEVEDLPEVWRLNRTHYFSEEPHAIRMTDVEVPKIWREQNGLPGLQMEQFVCLDDDGSQRSHIADRPMDWWVSMPVDWLMGGV